MKKKIRLLIILTLLLAALVTFAVGKYMQTIPVAGKVSFTASLANKVAIKDGNETISLIPGADITRDPRVEVSGKTEVPAYLFLEVDSETEVSTVTFALQPCWKPIVEGASVHVYSDSDGNPIVIDDKTTGLESIGILQGNTIYVSQYLKQGTTFNLTFSAVLKETYKDSNGQWESPTKIYGFSN